jgi:hypothetical protein
MRNRNVLARDESWHKAEGALAVQIQIEIDVPGAKSFELLSDIMGTQYPKLGSQVSLPDGVTVTFEQHILRESASIGDLIILVVEYVAAPAAINLATNWLYDKLKKHGATTLRTEGQEVPIEQDKVEWAFRAVIEVKLQRSKARGEKLSEKAGTPQKAKRRPSPLEVVAHHEAGHAVVARVRGRDVHGIYLRPNVKGTYNGETPYGDPTLPPDIDPNIPYERMCIAPPDGVSDTRVIMYAGKAAEILLFRQVGVSERLATLGTKDYRQIVASLKGEKLSWEQFKERLQKLEIYALHIISWPACWSAVEEIAHILVKDLSIEGERIHEIVTKAFG